MLEDKERKLFENVLQNIIDRPRPFYAQRYIAINDMRWCEDWEIIEILKYFINGEEMYLNDPPPNRLKNNTLWSKEDIVCKAKNMRDILGTAENIKNHIVKLRETVYAENGSA